MEVDIAFAPGDFENMSVSVGRGLLEYDFDCSHLRSHGSSLSMLDTSHIRACIKDTTSRILKNLGSLPPNPLDKIPSIITIYSIKYS